MICWSDKLVAEAFARLADTSRPLDERLAGLSYGDAAMAEAADRARKIAAKLAPLGPKAHGFYDPAGFMDRAFQRGENRRVFKRAYQRLLGVIIARDGLLDRGVA